MLSKLSVMAKAFVVKGFEKEVCDVDSLMKAFLMAGIEVLKWVSQLHFSSCDILCFGWF